MRRLTLREFIANARKVHGDKYDYSKVVYVNNKTKVNIICTGHGIFEQRPDQHLQGQGCPKCGGTCLKTTEQFVLDAVAIHGDGYDYSKVEYKGNNTKVCITCPEHGEFLITPSNHISNIAGCPACGKVKERLNASASILSNKFKGLVQPEDYKLIPLTKGLFAKVDNEDFDQVKDINWYYDDRYAHGSEYGYMHRYIMKCPKELVVDHKNHDKLDNRKVNLRVCEHVNNHWNRLSGDKFSSPYKGVAWINSTGKWRASIKINGVNKIIGHFDAESDAGKAFDLKAIELRGEFAYETLNFPELLTEYLKELKR